MNDSPADLDPKEIEHLIHERKRKGADIGHLAGFFSEKGDLDRSEIRRLLKPVLRRLEAEGLIVKGFDRRYFTPPFVHLATARVVFENDRLGLELTDGKILPLRHPMGAVPGDLVEILVDQLRAPRKARMRRIVERALEHLVAIVHREGSELRALPYNESVRMSILLDETGLSQTLDSGDWVEVSVDQMSDDGLEIHGTPIRRIGRAEEPGAIDALALALEHRRVEFPSEVEAEAAAFSELPPAELARRKDLRNEPVITIDGADAKDFDDGLSARMLEDGRIRASVHIADVAAYVSEGSALDREARKRGFSTYLPGRCVPMLPEALSNGWCSLMPDVDRLAFSVHLLIDKRGEISLGRSERTVIRSAKRATYDEASNWMENPELLSGKPYRESFEALHEGFRRLLAARHRRGSLDLDMPDSVLELDEDGFLIQWHATQRLDSHRLVEELMVAANRAVAMRLNNAGRRTLHRAHEAPDPEKVATLELQLQRFGREIEGDSDNPGPSQLGAVADGIEDEALRHTIGLMILRSLMRAVYQPDPLGHWALGLDDYLHFTSPIRRYPDLLAHRALASLLSGEPERAADHESLERLGETLSESERAAEAASRTARQGKLVLALRDRLGDVMHGRIVGVAPFGLFVRLEEMPIEGLVPVRVLTDDYYELGEDRLRLVGSRNGRAYCLGDQLEVIVDSVDLFRLRMSLRPVGFDSPPERGKPRGRRDSRGRDGDQRGKPSTRGSRRDSPANKGPKGRRRGTEKSGARSKVKRRGS